MSELGEFLGRFVGILEQAGVRYMFAGSLASTFHGAPRTTQDVDVVVELDARRIRALLERLPDDLYYVSQDAALDALRREGQFNIIDFATGWKADVIVRRSRPFSHEELRRRVCGRLLGVDLWLASAEDTIVSKLEWAARGGGSERQINDVRGVLVAKGSELDLDYVERWVSELGLAALWRQVGASAADGDEPGSD